MNIDTDTPEGYYETTETLKNYLKNSLVNITFKDGFVVDKSEPTRKTMKCTLIPSYLMTPEEEDVWMKTADVHEIGERMLARRHDNVYWSVWDVDKDTYRFILFPEIESYELVVS